MIPDYGEIMYEILNELKAIKELLKPKTLTAKLNISDGDAGDPKEAVNQAVRTVSTRFALDASGRDTLFGDVCKEAAQ